MIKLWKSGKMYQQLLEYTYNNMLRKQKSITKLFPKFFDRVKAVASKGGVKPVKFGADIWGFEVASGTKDGVKYDVTLHFVNIPEVLKKWAPKRSLWLEGKQQINYRKLAPEVINDVDMEWRCSCPADLYWGKQYIRTTKKANFGDPENRPPRIKNPRQYGAICKHGELVLEVLPWYTQDFAAILKDFYADEIQAIINSISKEKEKFKAAGKELGKKVEPKPEEEVEKKPEEVAKEKEQLGKAADWLSQKQGVSRGTSKP